VGFGVARRTAFLVAMSFGGAFLLAFFVGAFFLADARRFTGRFAVGRLAERRATGPFRAAFAGFPRRAAFRLAINPVLSEP
jgi:SNF family Na+-dependent transporter